MVHEAGHAWVAQTGGHTGDASIAEGFCELLSYAWLKRQPGEYATGLRDMIRVNPDPVYGDGFRAVHAAVQRRGMTAVLASLHSSGKLPS